MNITRRSDEFELKALSEKDGIGTFEGYAAFFNNLDRVDDIILPNAFDGVKAKDVMLFWSHNNDEVIGAPLELTPDAKGLYGKFELNLDVNRGREGYALLKAGHIKHMSIGYKTLDYEWDKERQNVRLLKKLSLMEISLVAIPANPKAEVMGVKSLPIEKEFEGYLREACGLSRNDAKHFISKHWKPFVSEKGLREAADNSGELDAIKDAFKEVRQAIKQNQ
jgi:hypothetical protein